MDVRDGEELSLLVEASEWLEWMQDQMANGLLNMLDEETSVLFAVRAIIRANRVALLYGSFPTSKKAPLVKSYIVFQCSEQQNTLRKHTECGPITLLQPLCPHGDGRLLRRFEAKYRQDGRTGTIMKGEFYSCFRSLQQAVAEIERVMSMIGENDYAGGDLCTTSEN